MTTIKYPLPRRYTRGDFILDLVSVLGGSILLFLAMTLERL